MTRPKRFILLCAAALLLVELGTSDAFSGETLTVGSTGEFRRIFDLSGKVIAESVDPLSWPLLTQSADIMDAGVKVGEITVARSLTPPMYETGAIALLAIALGTLVFAIVRLLPLRALNRALQENRKLIAALEDQVVEIRAAESRLASLYEITSSTSSTLDLRAVVELLLDSVTAFIPEAALQVWLVNPETGMPERSACRNLDEAEWKGRTLTRTPVLVEQAITRKLPVSVADARMDARIADRDFYRRQGMVSYLGLPLVANGQAVGDLVILTRNERQFDQEETDFFSALGSQAAVAIHNAQLHEQIRSQAEKLARSNTELEQFAYVASHDLQEPLRMITGYTTLLARRYAGRLDRDADEFIAYAVNGAKRMQELIEDLLSYCRLGRNGKPFSASACEAILARALASLKLAIEESGATVTHDPLPSVMGDATQLSQLFQNIIGNALKYRTSKAPEVHISCRREEANWVFSVKDNGIGIDPRFTEKLFVIFQRLHTRDEYPGTGLGLAICKKIVERHGGRIWVESELGNGAAFYFTIAAEPGSAPEPPLRSDAAHSNTGRPIYGSETL
jgi:signal transduction histidine kinase